MASSAPVRTLPPLLMLASNLLGEDALVRIQRQRDAGMTYRVIVLDLKDATDGQVFVTEQTVRAWLRDYASAAA